METWGVDVPGRSAAKDGYADSTAVVGVVGNGGKIKVIAQIIDSSPVGIIRRPSVSLKTAKAGMNQPQGKPFGTSQTAAWSSMDPLAEFASGEGK